MTNEEDTCELVRISRMAREDGEAGPLSEEAVQTHLSTCGSCRSYLASVDELRDVLATVSLARPQALEVWSSVAARLQVRRPLPTWQITAAVATLVVARLATLLVDAGGLVWLLQALLLVFAVAAFATVRLNPFRIEPNPEAAAEGSAGH